MCVAMYVDGSGLVCSLSGKFLPGIILIQMNDWCYYSCVLYILLCATEQK